MLLTDEQITARLAEMRDWARDEETIERDFEFSDFKAALAFVNRVAEVAEAMNHHPDILIYNWNNVTLCLMTHSEGGVTDKDFRLAAQINELA